MMSANLIRNPGRGLFWTNGGYNNLHFHHNHVKAATPTRPDGLFGFNAKVIIKTIRAVALLEPSDFCRCIFCGAPACHHQGTGEVGAVSGVFAGWQSGGGGQ